MQDGKGVFQIDQEALAQLAGGDPAGITGMIHVRATDLEETFLFSRGWVQSDPKVYHALFARLGIDSWERFTVYDIWEHSTLGMAGRAVCGSVRGAA